VIRGIRGYATRKLSKSRAGGRYKITTSDSEGNPAHNWKGNTMDLDTCSSSLFVTSLCDADFCNRDKQEKDFGIGMVQKNHRDLWTLEELEGEKAWREEVELDHLRDDAEPYASQKDYDEAQE
jgi:hypothetical protein